VERARSCSRAPRACASAAFDGTGNVGSDSSHANFVDHRLDDHRVGGANGSISPSGAVAVADGATPAVHDHAATGYHVQDVLGERKHRSAPSTQLHVPAPCTRTRRSPRRSRSTTTRSRSARRQRQRAAAVPNQLTYDHGTNVQITATPAGNWNFDSWTGDASGTSIP
jgi:hypothetical protein